MKLSQEDYNLMQLSRGLLNTSREMINIVQTRLSRYSNKDMSGKKMVEQQELQKQLDEEQKKAEAYNEVFIKIKNKIDKEVFGL